MFTAELSQSRHTPVYKFFVKGKPFLIAMRQIYTTLLVAEKVQCVLGSVKTTAGICWAVLLKEISFSLGISQEIWEVILTFWDYWILVCFLKWRKHREFISCFENKTGHSLFLKNINLNFSPFLIIKCITFSSIFFCYSYCGLLCNHIKSYFILIVILMPTHFLLFWYVSIMKTKFHNLPNIIRSLAIIFKYHPQRTIQNKNFRESQELSCQLITYKLRVSNHQCCRNQ